MGKKLSAWKTKGMNRDLSVSAFNPEFAFENMNLRLATNENNTVLSWVNEKGPAAIEVSVIHAGKEENDNVVLGTCIGTAVLNNYLVLFTTDTDKTKTPYAQVDRIYRLEYAQNDKTRFSGIILYEGNLGFNKDYSLETLVSYESEHIQKVYWTDGINQPRMINIAPEYNANGEEVIPSYTNTSFDFVPTLRLDETVSVKKVTGGGGMFAPGVIQYSFTYYNKHGQESNIFYTTPLYYISYADRGASPEDKVDNTFKITVYNLDTNFDYLRIYSIQRTSINSTPICKRIQDIEIVVGMTSVSYTDTGMSGDSIDPTELLYKGGSGVHVGTMDQKDNTLFMGDLTVLNTAPPKLTDAEKASILASVNEVRTFYVDIESSDNYVYGNQLTAMNSDDDSTSVSVPCAGFKHDDWYRLGVQFQDEFGRWTDPIFLKDVQVGNVPSSLVVESSGGGGGGGDDHGDTDLPLMIAFENKATDKDGVPQWITISGTVEMVVKNPESGANETVSVNLGSTDKIQISGGNYVYFPNAFVANGSEYKGWQLADGQNCIVKDGKGSTTAHTVDSLDTSLVLSRDNELLITCTKTSNPDVDPTPKPEPDPEPPIWTKGFEDLVKSFNTVLATPITENSATWNYLYANYTLAEDEWNNNTLGLFNIIESSEVYNYRKYEPTYYDIAHTAMHAWLMAMCLTELIPTTGTSSNRQTLVFQKAYELGGGSTVPIYGDFIVRSDVTAARLVAGAVYAYNHDDYASQIPAMRTELGGTMIPSSVDSSLGFVDERVENSEGVRIGYTILSYGYMVNTGSFLPNAPGPRIPEAMGYSLPYPSAGSFDTDKNYVEDATIDDFMVEEYNLGAQTSEATWRGYSHDKKQRIVQVMATPPCTKVYMFGAEKPVKYTGTVDQPCVNPITGKSIYDRGYPTSVGTSFKRHTFEYGTDSDNLSIKGPFSMHPDLYHFVEIPESQMTNYETAMAYVATQRTAAEKFMDTVTDIADSSRYPTYDPNYGRRRPGAASNLTANPARVAIPGHQKNELYNIDIAYMVADDTWGQRKLKDANGNILVDGLASDAPTSYPSGHSAQIWALAMLLTQANRSNMLAYVKNAYEYSVNRSIGRFHWNSDVMYGKLFGTIALPLINAMEGMQSGYSAFKTAVGGGGGDDITINLTINNNCGYDARFTGEIYFYLFKDNNTDYDNTGKHAYQGGITLPGFVDMNKNKIAIDNGESKTFPVRFPAATIARLSDTLASEAVCAHVYNAVLYSKGKNISEGYDGPIGAAYVCGFVNNDNMGQTTLIDGESYFVNLVGVSSGMTDGNVTIDPLS